MTALRLDWCTYDAANYAVKHWHYSHVMPAGKMARVGVWENDAFIGVVLFSRGANNNIGKPYGLKQEEICELTRIALKTHQTPVSRIMSIAIKMLHKQSPGVRLIISYADPAQSHVGGVYQAMGWLYIGYSDNWRGSHYIINGKPMHGRSVRSKWGSEKNITVPWEIAPPANKHKYLYPLDDDMRRQIEPLRKPYPKRADSVNSSTAGVQPDGGGANPTSALLHEPEAADG